LRVGDDGDLN